VPAHLLTVEAIRMYLTHLTPDGVLILHLSNRNLNLRGPAMAGARAAGGFPLMQLHQYSTDKDGNALPPMWESAEHAVIVGRTPEALARFRTNSAWCARERSEGRPWTDDYTNLFGALVTAQADRAQHRDNTCVDEPPPPPVRRPAAATPASPP
jgi:hypothetical protein